MGSRKRRAPRKSLASTTQNKRFPVGDLARQRASLREEYLSKSKELKALRKRIKRVQNKTCCLQECLDTTPKSKRSITFEVSCNTSTTRKKSPTQICDDGTLNLPRRSAYRRELETLCAATEINGGTVENRDPAIAGMLSTIVKYGKMEDITKHLCHTKKVRKSIISDIKDQARQYEKSEENLIRSLSLLYGGGIIGKTKYEEMRSAVAMKNTGKTTKKGYASKKRITFGLGITLPKPLAYRNLIHEIQAIDMGETFSLNETLCSSLPADQKVNGQYRDLEAMLISLSTFYLETDKHRKESEKLMWFGDNECTFKVAVGGDGAPFGKWDESMSWLISFLNVGPRVGSPNDNFLLFGANCKEDHTVVRLFTKQLCNKIQEIEKKTYRVLGKDVSFTFELVPSDMKFMAFLNGELNNAATYHSSFANVSKHDQNTLNQKFGKQDDCKWKPWNYERRLVVAKKVKIQKETVSKKLAKSTQRSRITNFINSQNSRQEFEPLIGKLCDKALIEPLHLKNNGVQHLHTQLLNLALSTSNLPTKISTVSELPPNCAITRYLNALESEVKAGRLRKQLVKWILDERGRDKDFNYRLTGKDSRLILHGFMYLIEAILGDSNDISLLVRLLCLVYIAIKLRDCASRFSMYHISPEAVIELERMSKEYFTAVSLFCGKVTATVWHIGHVTPVHTRWCFEKYRTGLGINTMQGREAKHVQISSYAKNSKYQQRWQQVFRHDFISKIWLPLHNTSLLTYHKSNDSLIPSRVTQAAYCYCGFHKNETDDKCVFCSHAMMSEIEISIATGNPTSTVKSYINV